MSTPEPSPAPAPRGGTGVPGRVLVGWLLVLAGVAFLFATHALLDTDGTRSVEDPNSASGGNKDVTCGSVRGAENGDYYDDEGTCSRFRDVRTGYAIETGVVGVLLVGGGALVLRRRPGPARPA